MNLDSKLNLKSIKGSFVADIKGKTKTERCICIPINNTGLDAKGDKVWLYATIYELRETSKYGATHSIKQSMPKDVYETMTEDERKTIPFLGDAKPIKGEVKVDVQSPIVMDDNNDDMPF